MPGTSPGMTKIAPFKQTPLPFVLRRRRGRLARRLLSGFGFFRALFRLISAQQLRVVIDDAVDPVENLVPGELASTRAVNSAMTSSASLARPSSQRSKSSDASSPHAVMQRRGSRLAGAR